MQIDEPSQGNAGTRPLVRGCECGAVQYRVADAFLYAMNCHCSRCRAATGSACKASWFQITDDLPQFDEYPT